MSQSNALSSISTLNEATVQPQQHIWAGTPDGPPFPSVPLPSLDADVQSEVSQHAHADALFRGQDLTRIQKTRHPRKFQKFPSQITKRCVNHLAPVSFHLIGEFPIVVERLMLITMDIRPGMRAVYVCTESVGCSTSFVPRPPASVPLYPLTPLWTSRVSTFRISYPDTTVVFHAASFTILPVYTVADHCRPFPSWFLTHHIPPMV